MLFSIINTDLLNLNMVKEINLLLITKKSPDKPGTHCEHIRLLTSPKPRKQTTIVQLDFYLTFYSLDHFLQPKDKNTQHKLKISHLIVYNFSSLIIISYFQSDIHTHLEAVELRCSAPTCQTWLEKVNLMPPPSPQKTNHTILFYSQDRPGRGVTNRFSFQNTMDAFSD